jgi:5'-nucleotidase
MRVVYDRSSRSFKEFSLNGEPVADDRIYQVGLQHYHFVNIESFFGIPLEEVSRNGTPRAIATSCFEIIDEYLSSQQNLDREVCGRLVVE